MGDRLITILTLLFQTDKRLLKNSLNSPIQEKFYKSVATSSVPSPTTNLLSSNENLDMFLDEFVEELCDQLDVTEFVNLEEITDLPHQDFDHGTIAKSAEVLEAWDWIYGKTPKFTYKDELVVKG